MTRQIPWLRVFVNGVVIVGTRWRTSGLSPSYGLLTTREAHEWFLRMMREHEEFEVETDQAGEWPMPV